MSRILGHVSEWGTPLDILFLTNMLRKKKKKKKSDFHFYFFTCSEQLYDHEGKKLISRLDEISSTIFQSYAKISYSITNKK